MISALLLSILVVTVAMPSFAAKDRDAVRGLKKLLFGMAGFSVFYWLVVVFLTPRA